jgi:hypothetical protein
VSTRKRKGFWLSAKFRRARTPLCIIADSNNPEMDISSLETVTGGVLINTVSLDTFEVDRNVETNDRVGRGLFDSYVNVSGSGPT